MKNQWVHKISGYVRIKISGPYPELFINRCIDNGINIWDIHSVGKEVLVCSVLLDETPKLRRMARLSDCKIKFIQRKGFPFLWAKLWKRNGLLFGAAAFFALLYILSNMVWGIEIEGASAPVEHDLREAVTDLGIKQGAFQFRLPPPEEIQSIVTDKITDATWIGVTKKGTTYHFQVVEKQLAEKEPKEAPGHIVAKQKAVVYDLFVEEGKPVVEINQLVEKGEMLVSGLIGKEGEEEQVAAKGEILGEMWYEASVEIPLSRTLHAVTGNQYRTHQLYFGDFSIPIWGWNPPEYEHIKEENYKGEWEIFGFQMPINYGYKDVLEAEEIEKEKAVEQAIEIAVEEGGEKVLSQFSDSAQKIDEKVLHHEVEDGKVIVIIHYRIVDEIGTKQPIIQGD
ncbi:sporulation protein YqfD [Evansella cellulosilytica]|uniref:Sporulation protein YqfD n=1 Tax=Evansella cellulosilytica (strain ATCC 21833 / DSM 2522 / FERM P-1141 / JCM 9156 / N-4) TaxID=649639 RepID=E6TW41_EVAC2|nr:sporulation protein YqfD [Evansella cellulosilytica]ADU29864.1 sporulation protein YqfD [Evansella cellulosilytica DSM 2522]